MNLPVFQQRQLRFAQALRNPEAGSPEGIEPRRFAIYQELFYNNVEGFLSRAFPVLRALSDDAIWHARVRDFFARYRCQDPRFNGIAEAFVDYVANMRGIQDGDPPFLPELVHYEWVELALSIAEDPVPDPSVQAEGDLLENPPVLSPLAWLLVYQWPVHHIGPEYQPAAAPHFPTYLCVYRDRGDDVRFMVLNAVSARLLQLIEEGGPASGRLLLETIATELGHADSAPILHEGQGLLDDWRERGILRGARRNAADPREL